MTTQEDWRSMIVQSGGKIIGGCVPAEQIAKKEYLDAGWFYRNPEHGEKKAIRDKMARTMRKDGWIVKSESNSLGWFLEATRERKEGMV